MTPSLEAELRVLADKSALDELVQLYCRAIDRRDYTLLLSLYHDGAIEDRGAIYSGSAEGYVAWLPEVMANFELTMHTLYNRVFVIDGDRAEGEIYADAYHRTHPPERKEVVAGGRYLDRYERRNGIWRFTYRTTTFERCVERTVDPAAWAHFTAGSISARTDGDDLSYTALTLLGRGKPRR
jgi:hypothetical protein